MPHTPAGTRLTGTLLSTSYQNADIGSLAVTAATYTPLAGAFSIPGGEPQVGDIYLIEAWGNGVWGSTAQNLSFNTTIGGQATNSLNFDSSVFPVNTLFRWHIRAMVICLAVGSTGTFQTMIEGTLSAYVLANGGSANLVATNNNAASTIHGTVSESSGTYTVDTTVTESFVLQAKWGSTTGAPTITKQNSIQRRLGTG